MNDIERKSYAESLKHNKLLQMLLDDLSGAALTKWIATSPDGVDLREEAWNEYKAVEKLQIMIDNTISELTATDPQE